MKHALIVALAAGIAGCSGGEPIYPVSGKVQFADGTPLTVGWVVFESVDPARAATARGNIQPDGTFKLTTRDSEDGARVGKYRALIGTPTADGDQRGPRTPPPIDSRFTDFTTSGLEFTVTDTAENNQFTLPVESPAANPRGKR